MYENIFILLESNVWLAVSMKIFAL